MKRFAVIGLGRFGYRVAITLAEEGAEVIVIDRDKNRIEEIKDRVTMAIWMDSTGEDSLRSQGINAVDTAIVSMGEDFESSLLTTVLLKKLGVKEVITRAKTEVQGEILKLVGADRVIFPDDEIGRRLARSLLITNILDYIPLSEGYSVAQVKAPKNFWGAKLKDLNLRQQFNVNVVSIKESVRTINARGEKKISEKVYHVPDPEHIIKEEDVLIIVGRNEDIEKIARE